MSEAAFVEVLNDKLTNKKDPDIAVHLRSAFSGQRRRPTFLNIPPEEGERFARIFKKGDELAKENHIEKDNWEDAKNKYLRKELSLDELDAYLQRITPNHKRNPLFSGAIDDSSAAIQADEKSRGTGVSQFTKPSRSIFQGN